MPRFVVQDSHGVVAQFAIPEGAATIGRSPENALRLLNRGVSRQHARVTRDGDAVLVEDLHSHNGTFLNSRPVTALTRLKHMDVLQLGDTVLVYDEFDNDSATQADTPAPADLSLRFLQECMGRVRENVARVVRGKDEVIERAVLCLLCDGHVLIEDVPGVGKTVLAQALAKSVRGDFRRIQFTPDMLPTDITGVSVYDEPNRQFTFVPGPIFGNVILADEINRGTPRTQSSLLECMSDAVVTVDGQAHVLPKPFFVVATQNPVDFHGTYPLPEAQLDRFLMRLHMGYPSGPVEREILGSQIASHPLNDISYVVRSADVLQCQALVRTVHVSDAVRDYVVSIAEATRRHPALAYGCSPRASLALMRVGQAQAALRGRDYVLPRDVRDLAVCVLSHRLPLKLQARAEWENSEQVVSRILDQLPLEKWEST